ncbi:hypothetical protein [Lacrimispora indolis]|uniref:hypothetical protein n=1 Tax=Lacrimispora indolis TaxID=69825 RepID=UPI0003F70543|nr:hypothetical protein [[Clostridium] methoxybenzovorans]
MKDKLILNDGTTIELEAGASLAALTTAFTDWTAAADVLPKLTEDNLANVHVKNGDGTLDWNYRDLVLQPGSWEEKADGLYITISLREKTDIEKRLDAVETGQEAQDGAIAELAGNQGGVQ